MKKYFSYLLVNILLFTAAQVKAQNYDDPAVYMKAINSAQADFNKIYMSYVSAAWHSNRATKIERLRQQVIDNLTTTRYKIIDLPIYKGDNGLRKSSIDYLWLMNKVFVDDYSHLVNMESLIDQSFDKMELYLLFEEKINDTLKAANDKMIQAEKDFAAKYNVTLVDNKSGVSEKIATSNKVSKYRNRVYLLFFKCAWQESLLMDAITKKNITKTEQARSALLKYATDGMAGLDSVATYDNDATLAAACKESLGFFKDEAETYIPKVSDYLLKEEDFGKLKKTLDAKPQNTKTKEDTDTYNKAVSDLNALLVSTNQTVKTLFTNRNKVMTNWDKAETKFSEAHMPYYR